MKVGFIGLGNVGASLAGNILRNGFELIVRDLDSSVTEQFRLMGPPLPTLLGKLPSSLMS